MALGQPLRSRLRVSKQVTLVVQKRAYARILRGASATYIDDIYVNRRYRRRGYASQLLQFAMRQFPEPIELDIRHQSKVLQRIATRFGYEKREPSLRYPGCVRWVPTDACQRTPEPSLAVSGHREYTSDVGTTIVLYLR